MEPIQLTNCPGYESLTENQQLEVVRLKFLLEKASVEQLKSFAIESIVQNYRSINEFRNIVKGIDVTKEVKLPEIKL